MNSHALISASRIMVLGLAVLAVSASFLSAADLQPATLRAWAAYVEATERRIASELKSGAGFLAMDFQAEREAMRERCQALRGEIQIAKVETLNPSGKNIAVPDGQIHHWRGSVFVPGSRLEDVLDRVIHPSTENTRQEDVLQARVLERSHDSLKIYLKLQRSKLITVVYSTEHAVRLHRYGTMRASSVSTATKIAELECPNSSQEREKPEGKDRGFLWRMNSYWRYEQVAGGVLIECESITLSRSVPSMLSPFISPVIESTARESMQRTLSSMRDRLTRAGPLQSSTSRIRS